MQKIILTVVAVLLLQVSFGQAGKGRKTAKAKATPYR